MTFSILARIDIILYSDTGIAAVVIVRYFSIQKSPKSVDSGTLKLRSSVFTFTLLRIVAPS